MKKFTIILLLLAFIPLEKVSAQLDLKLKEKLGDNIAFLLKGINDIQLSALNQGNYALTQETNKLLIFLEGFQKDSKKILNKTLEKVDDITRSRIEQIARIANGLDGSLITTDLAIKTSIQDLCDKFSILCSDDGNYRLSYIDGQILIYTKDNFKLKFKGTAFNNNSISRVALKLGDKELMLNTTEDDNPSSIISYKIPFKEIEPYFKDEEISALKYHLIVTQIKRKKTWIFFNKNYIDTLINRDAYIYLLPRYPVKYELIQEYGKETLIEKPEFIYRNEYSIPWPEYQKNSKTQLSQVVKLNDDEIYKGITISPTKIYRTRFQLGEWGWRYWGVYTNVDAKLINSGRELSLKFNAEAWVDDVAFWDIARIDAKMEGYDRGLTGPALKLVADITYSKKALVPTNRNSYFGNDKTRLPYGETYSEILDPNYNKYILKVTPFYWLKNHETYELDPSINRKQLNYIEIQSEKIGERLRVNVNYIR